MNSKSLFIVGQARSATTSLQRVCCEMLKFKNGREHLNNRIVHKYFPELNIPEFPLWGPVEYWPLYKDISLKFLDGYVVKDVCQQTFVVNNLEWIREHFNVLYIERPIDEVEFTVIRRGWIWQHLRAMRAVLNRVEWKNRIEYHDYITDSTILPKILERMYGYCHAYDYMDERFLSKRAEVLSRPCQQKP